MYRQKTYLPPEIIDYTGKRTDNDGTERHYMNGNLHRLDGPAVDYTSEWNALGFTDGYFIRGHKYWTLDSYLEDATIDEEERVYLKLKLKDKFIE